MPKRRLTDRYTDTPQPVENTREAFSRPAEPSQNKGETGRNSENWRAACMVALRVIGLNPKPLEVEAEWVAPGRVIVCLPEGFTETYRVRIPAEPWWGYPMVCL